MKPIIFLFIFLAAISCKEDMYSEHGLHPIYASDEYSVSTESSSGIVNYRNRHGKVAFTEKEWALDITKESNPYLYFYKLK